MVARAAILYRAALVSVPARGPPAHAGYPGRPPPLPAAAILRGEDYQPPPLHPPPLHLRPHPLPGAGAARIGQSDNEDHHAIHASHPGARSATLRVVAA